MTDPRVSPDPALAVLSEPKRVTAPLVDLRRQPDGSRDRQLLYGDEVTVLHHADGWSLVCAAKDGYCGYLPSDSLGSVTPATHKVTARATHAYTEPDLKSPEQHSLSFGSQITALSETATFIETELGHIPRQHLHRTSDVATDPAAVAGLFLSTPYLWGGNSAWGIDCSGLVQIACLACGLSCPGDSDQQAKELGRSLPPGTPYERNDLLFWDGHVAWVQTSETLLHANAGHMSVAEEPIDQAIDRIAAQGDGPVTLHKRLSLPDG
ncbi:C40 family peptidase [Roseobacter sinensis]|uniref:C40 family peptidase n=1 Tax=Roseobacter sinensis TaxID=2931391 RepID=A0ABT3B9D4_9RHOB|nr:C40 family peptidase [Roseobacter sp. WL0113]MCV3270153.1 C40 family peptidase [Roseobacter sp. WL0113]